MNRPIDQRNVHGATLTRRRFLAGSGALLVTVGALPGTALMALEKRGDGATPDATRLASWLEIHADNSVTLRTGKCDFGQGSIYTAYRQIVAEELGVPLEAITTVVSGDTDLTPDGGGTFGLLRTNVLNLRKVAAFTREAALQLAAAQLQKPGESLTLEDGVFSDGERRLSYGELVMGQSLQLDIPVAGQLESFVGLIVGGNPPLKPQRDYSIVGKSVPNSQIAHKVRAETEWVTNVRLPGMLHARVIHPATLGSTLQEVGALDAVRYPGARIVRKNNLLAVVSADEWEAVQAARVVAASTRWSPWKGLPGQDKLFDYLAREADWSSIPVTEGLANRGVTGTLNAARTHSAQYQVPYLKHAPIGPSMALADVRKEGTVTLHVASQHPQFLRHQIARMLGIDPDAVVIRTYAGPGHYGRSNGGNAGGEDEAVILSRELGVPVRVQWMRHDDMQWSTQSPASLSEIRIALDEAGRMLAVEAEHFAPPIQDDRLVGALLAGLPAGEAPGLDNAERVRQAMHNIADPWVYGEVPNLRERGHATPQLGQAASPLAIGLRDHSMRTPIQFQQNFPREVAISEAAALAGKDPLQFRIDHISEPRLKDILQRVRKLSGWATRPSPHPDASAQGDSPLGGQGVSVMFRGNAYWACASRISVTPSSGRVLVDSVSVVIDPGIVVNPQQLKRQVEAGCLQGVSHVLHEEVAFDKGAVTSADWYSYPIMNMGEAPEVRVEVVSRDDAEIYGQGSEAANALAASAIAAAFFDATGKPARRFPLRPEYVRAVLAG